MNRRVALYGATGHTGRFIAAEMERRGWQSILGGRDLSRLAPLAARHSAEARPADISKPAELDALLVGADAVINAAGPFGDTAPHLIEAALRAGIPYFDVTAEPFVAQELFENYAVQAREKGIVVAPAFGFFGALGDLLVTAAMDDWADADSVELAFALDRWRPTNGTRLAGARRAGRRLVQTDGHMEVRDPAQPAPRGTWHFGPPFGEQPVIGEFSTVDVVTIKRHARVKSIATWINEAPIADLTSPDTSGPEAADESGRSAQIFVIEAVARRGVEVRRATISGRDIYAVTAPIVCEGVNWVLDGRAGASGVSPGGELFDARAFLEALSSEQIVQSDAFA